MANFQRGSEWRKWDLHMHTPYTFKNTYNCSDNDFIDRLINKEIKVIGLTNYFKFDNKEFELAKKLEDKGIKVFLNLEIRLDYQNKDDDCLDIHIIFNSSVNQEQIDKLLHNLTVNIKGLSKKCIDLKSEEDFRYAVINFDHLLEVLNDDSLNIKAQFLIGFLSRGKGNARSSSNYEKLAKKADFLIHSSDNTINIIEDRKFWLNYRKPLLQSSDTHNLLDIGFKFTWIKTDPTFEGLKQVIYEPKDRVKIQDNNPNEDFPKQVFSEIKIKETEIFSDSNVKFKQQNIPLNSNLITIIGGRGTGKSLLLDCISKVFNKSNKRAENISIQNDDFIVEFTKFDGTQKDYKIQDDNVLDYLHINQGYVKEIVDPKEANKLDLEIKKLLNIKEINFSKEESEIIYLIDKIFEIKNFLLKVDEYGNKINSKQYIKKQLEKKRQLIKNITTNQNQELIRKYTKNLKSINSYSQKKEYLDKFKTDLNNFQNDKNSVINKINQTIQIEENKIPLISFTKQIEKIEDLIKKFTEKINKLNDVNKNIREAFISQGIKGDITTLLEQTKKYQDEIDKLTQKLKEIEEKENSLNEKFKSIEKLILTIEQDYFNYKNEVTNKWSKLRNGKDNWKKEQKELINKLLKDIEIEAEEIFDIDKFYELLKDYFGILNMMKFRATKDKNQSERVREFFNIKNKDDYKKFLKNEFKTQDGILFKELLDSDYFNKDGAKEFLKLLILDFNKYWKVITKPKYKNKEMHQLSVGMKGTMFLCIKLATDPFMKPFIFDQPEDDLDNDFIVNELVPIFREIKKYRQVVIVTHNANLVVNADAEQVIIAKNKNEELSYISGSIENLAIRKEICNILEGGKEAFENRKNKYNFKGD